MIQAGLHGFLLSLGLILPLGVQNLFVFTQGAIRKKLHLYLPVVLTASLCDTMLIGFAVLGVSAVVLAFSWLKTILVGGGFLFLLYMGTLTWRSRPQAAEDARAEEGAVSLPIRKVIGFTMMVSLLNPHAILDTVGVIGTSSAQYQGTVKLVFALSCIAVSWLWFFGLALLGSMTGTFADSTRALVLLNKGSAILMWGAAFYLLASHFA